MIENIKNELQQYIHVAWSEEDIIELRPLPLGKGLNEWVKAIDLLDPKRIERMLSENKAGANVYAGILPRPRVGVTQNVNIELARVIWCDFDYKHKVVSSFDDAFVHISNKKFPPPSMAVETGHGLHLFWKLDRCYEIVHPDNPKDDDSFTLFLKRFTTFVGADRGAANSERVLRLPGFRNMKDSNEEVYAKIVYADPNCVYSFKKLNALVPEELPNETKPSSATPNKSIAWSGSTSDNTMIRARAYADSLPGSPKGGRNNQAYRLACVLVNDYQLEASEALGILSAWDSGRNNPPIQSESSTELARILESARKHAKKETGNKLNNDIKVDSVQLPAEFSNTPEAEPEIKVEKKKQGRTKSYEVAFRKFLNPGGTLQLMCDYINAGAYKLQPELSLMAAIVSMGQVVGRVVCDEFRTMTNMYAIGIAPTGQGKDRALDAIEEIFEKAGLGDLFTNPTFVSDSALIRAIAEKPCCYSMIDEIGEYLKTLKTGGKRNHHLQGMLKELLRLYSSNKKAFRSSGAISHSDRTIYSPCYSLYGCTVAESLYDGLSTESITSGFLPRFFLMEGRSQVSFLMPNNDNEALLAAVVDSLKYWTRLRNDILNEGNVKDIQQKTGKPGMMIYPYESGVRDYYAMQFERLSRKTCEVGYPFDALWTRVGENGTRVALIHACGLKSGKVTLESAKYGIEFAEADVMMKECRLRGNLYENEDQQIEKLILNKIEENGGTIGQRDLGQKTKHKINVIQRNKIIKALIDGGVIEAVSVGRKTTYSLIED